MYNKNYFAQKTSEILNENPDKEWLLICSNIKDFKLVNDLFGLEKGNEVLKMEADLLKAQCGEGSVYGRTGGDKFAICIPKEEFKEQDFMDAIQTMGHAFNNDLYHLHIYVGVYEITDRNEEVSIMCDKANLAIKTLGKTMINQLHTIATRYFMIPLPKSSWWVILIKHLPKNSSACIYSHR